MLRQDRLSRSTTHITVPFAVPSLSLKAEMDFPPTNTSIAHCRLLGLPLPPLVEEDDHDDDNHNNIIKQHQTQSNTASNHSSSIA
jgi:hypothetical protein